MSTVILDTITGKSTATTITIGSTPVVSASANSMTIRGEGSAQTSIQQGLNKFWANVVANGTSVSDSFNQGSFTDSGTGIGVCNYTTNMANANYVSTLGGNLIDYDAGNSVRLSQTTAQATGSCNIDAFYIGSSGTVIYEDRPKLVSVAGDLA